MLGVPGQPGGFFVLAKQEWLERYRTGPVVTR